MAHRPVGLNCSDRNAQLFAQLAPQARFPRFAGLPLAPGELPAASERVVGKPLTDEDATATFNHRDGGLETFSV